MLDYGVVALGAVAVSLVVNAVSFAWLLEKLNTLFADAKQETAEMMDKKLGPISKNVAALVAVAGHDTVAPRGSPERPRGAVASSITGLAELIQPRDSGPSDTAGVAACEQVIRR